MLSHYKIQTLILWRHYTKLFTPSNNNQREITWNMKFNLTSPVTSTLVSISI